MTNLYKYFVITFQLLFFTSCAAVKYGAVVGAQKSTYTESGSASSLISSDQVTFSNYENSSSGFHIGISEESKWVLTKIYYFNNTYEDLVYNFEGTNYNTALKETGFKGTLAIKLGFFQPHLSVTSYNSLYLIDEDEYDKSYSTVGAGIDLEIPISKRAYAYIGINTDTYDEIAFEGLAQINQSLHHQTVYAGIRFNFSADGAVEK